MKSSSSKLQLWSAYLGNLFEHYDTALFGFLSPLLAPLIFPKEEPAVALIFTYAMIPLGMVARPLGSIFFGFIGDFYGRKQALFLTLAGMALISGCIALTPTFAEVGVLSPLIFCFGRVLQNFFSSGEAMGGAIFLLENAPEKKHDLLSSFYNASTVGGILLASWGVFLISFLDVTVAGWRFLYGFGCITALFGFIIRTKTTFDSPVVESSVKGRLRLFWEERRALFVIALGSGFSYANYLMALVLMNGFIPLVTSLTTQEMVRLNTGLLIFDFFALPFFGWLSSKISRQKVMLGASLGVAVLGAPLLILLKGASLLRVVGIRTALVLLGVAFAAPFHAWTQNLVPKAHRYAVVSFGYALGSQVLGGGAAAISLWLFHKTGSVASLSWYWVFLAALMASVFLMPQYFLSRESEKCSES